MLGGSANITKKHNCLSNGIMGAAAQLLGCGSSQGVLSAGFGRPSLEEDGTPLV